MVTTVSPVYQEFNPAKKTPAYANGIIQILRRDWRRMVNTNRAIGDRATLYSVQELKNVKDSFDDEEFKKCTTFTPLPILEPMLNAVVEEITANPPRSILKALDPTSIIEKQQDIELLKNRSILENDRSELQSRVGLPDYKLGQENFAGNVDQFDKLGFDSNDPEDVTFYETNLQKLKAEVAGQSVIDAVFKNCRFDKETSRRLVKDIFSMKIACTQKYVDKISGEIKDRYIDPQIAYGIFGRTNEGKDDICRGWQDGVTIMEWLQMVGDQFDFMKDWRFLLWGINYCNNTRFTGFIRNNVPFDCCGDGAWMSNMGLGELNESNLLDWSMAYTYKVYVGYIEWRSPEATSTFLTKNDNPNFVEQIPYDYLLKKKQIRDGYEKESRYQIPWYSSYFIATTSVSQWIWGFGKVFMQTTYGANDEYCNGTLNYYQEEGLSATEIAKTYLELANFTYYRMRWIIFKAKPDPDEYVYDELIQLAGKVQREFPQAGTGAVQTPGLDNVLTNLIKQMRAKHIKLRTYPRIDGRAVQQIHTIEKNGQGGLDPIALSMQAVCQWAEQNIASKIGINALRLGGNPQPRESKDSEDATVNYSMQTTGYIYRMVQYLKESSAVASLNYAQDIIKYKASLPYKWLLKIVGIETIQDLKILDKFAAHRCGLFIEDYNTDLDKKELRAAAFAALQNGEIGWDDYFNITQTSDPRRASLLLGRYKQKAEKAKAQAEMDKVKAIDDNAKAEHDREMERMQFDRETRWGQEDRKANGFIAAAQINKQGRIDVEQIKQENEIPNDAAKTKGKVDVEKAKKGLDVQPEIIDKPTPPVQTTSPTPTSSSAQAAGQ